MEVSFFYLKGLITLIILLFLLVTVNSFLRKRIKDVNVKNVKTIPINGEDRIVAFEFEGERFVIFSTKNYSLVLKRERILNDNFTIDTSQNNGIKSHSNK
jgi:hypothetical protein